MYFRKASSMIELVIAIVIMGIAMMTLPMMLTRVQNNNEFAMQQEAILIARTQLGDILTYPWDEYSEDASYNVGILDTNGSTDYNRTNRIGLVHANKRRKFFSNETNASSSLGQDSGDYDDIDDFITATVKNSVNDESGDANATLGYKLSKESNITISAKYIDDSNTTAVFDFNASSTPASTTNIKMITVSIKNTQIDGNITLRAFSSNIGANQLLRRTW